MSRYLVWFFLGSVFILSPFIGSAELDINKISDLSTLDSSIFFELRVPRVLFAFLQV